MKRRVVSALVFVLIAGFAFAQADLQTIATVKLERNEPITIKQVRTRVEAYQKEMGRVITVDEKKKVLDGLINERLVVQAAEKYGIKISDAEVTQSFTQMISQQVGKPVTELEFAQMIKQQTGMSLDDYMRAQNGMTLAEYKTFLKSQLLGQKYVRALKGTEIQSVPGPSDKDIRSFYEINKQSFVQPDMVSLFLVVVPKGTSADENAAAKKKLEDFQKQLRTTPASAADIKLRSKAANSGYQAGELFINKSQTTSQQLGITMDSLLKIFAMNKNEVSDITETGTDFQCFLVQEKYSAKILDIGDTVKPGTTVTVYEYIKTNLYAQIQSSAENQAFQQIINDLRKSENYTILKEGAELDKALSW